MGNTINRSWGGLCQLRTNWAARNRHGAGTAWNVAVMRRVGLTIVVEALKFFHPISLRPSRELDIHHPNRRENSYHATREIPTCSVRDNTVPHTELGRKRLIICTGRTVGQRHSLQRANRS
jgi:hypothetical protein